LMMNGVLLQNSLFPVTVMNRDSEEFHTTLRDFYNTGNATDMMGFFADATARLYPEETPPTEEALMVHGGYIRDSSGDTTNSDVLCAPI
ncbi:MAG: hypothetical protein LBN28_02815, partial [Desulfovibrio sp.]|nr:hypothetical protein [Desulfovibrio sp.]